MWHSAVQHRYPGDSEMEGAASWERKGQLFTLGNVVTQGYDRFNKIEDSPCEGGGLHVRADISCEPAAAFELSDCVFRNWKVIIDPWFHTQWRREQMIKYLGETSPPNRSIIPAFSTLSSSFSVIARSRHTIYGLHRDYALPILSS